MPAPTGWHWHDMTAHYVYVLRGSLTFRFAGVEGDVTLRAGDGLSQPAGVPHNVIARSDDLEVIEINEPARIRHVESAGAAAAMARDARSPRPARSRRWLAQARRRAVDLRAAVRRVGSRPST